MKLISREYSGSLRGPQQRGQRNAYDPRAAGCTPVLDKSDCLVPIATKYFPRFQLSRALLHTPGLNHERRQSINTFGVIISAKRDLDCNINTI